MSILNASGNVEAFLTTTNTPVRMERPVAIGKVNPGPRQIHRRYSLSLGRLFGFSASGAVGGRQRLTSAYSTMYRPNLLYADRRYDNVRLAITDRQSIRGLNGDSSTKSEWKARGSHGVE